MGTVCRKTSQRKERLSWHLPLRPSPPLSLRLMPIPTTTEDTVLDTAVVGMARGRLRLSPRLMPIPTTTEDTDMGATELTVSDTDTVSDTAVVSTATARGRLSPTTESTLPTPPLEEPTLVPDATSPTLLEPSMLPRGRLRPTPGTTEDTDTEDTVSDTGDTVSDTAVASTGVRF